MSHNTCPAANSDLPLEPPFGDLAEQARQRLRDLVAEGLASGQGRQRTEDDEKRLMAFALGEIDAG